MVDTSLPESASVPFQVSHFLFVVGKVSFPHKGAVTEYPHRAVLLCLHGDKVTGSYVVTISFVPRPSRTSLRLEGLGTRISAVFNNVSMRLH